MDGNSEWLLDGGRIRGGFQSDYAARIFPPQDSALVAAITNSVGADRYTKVDVEIVPLDGKPWIFSAAGVPETTSVFTTPNSRVVSVATGGEVHFVDTATRTATQLGRGPIECAASDVQGGRLFLADFLFVYAFDAEKCIWQSRRISIDGVRMLTYADGYVSGVGVGVADDAKPFTINAANGEAKGGVTRWPP